MDHNRLHGGDDGSPKLSPGVLDDGTQNIAEGKPFVLGASHRNMPKAGVVQAKAPYFFHTAIAIMPMITVDLENVFNINKIRVLNRTDGNYTRASSLYALLHHMTDPATGSSFAFSVSSEFLSGRRPDAELRLPCVGARYVTIVSPLKTALHFSDLQIFGEEA